MASLATTVTWCSASQQQQREMSPSGPGSCLMGVDYIGSLPAQIGAKICPHWNIFWMWICLLQAPPSTYLDKA